MRSNKITVITVSYNSSATIRDTIESVLSQTYSGIEYIVIDGGSNDGTMDIIMEYRDSIDFLVSEPDDGIYYAMNKGLSLATGNVVGFLNSDDVFATRDTISLIASAFDNNEIDAVYGDIGARVILKQAHSKKDGWFLIQHYTSMLRSLEGRVAFRPNIKYNQIMT
jgi:glycosyltransferase involved in cell wall biosynthesis